MLTKDTTSALSSAVICWKSPLSSCQTSWCLLKTPPASQSWGFARLLTSPNRSISIPTPTPVSPFRYFSSRGGVKFFLPFLCGVHFPTDNGKPYWLQNVLCLSWLLVYVPLFFPTKTCIPMGNCNYSQINVWHPVHSVKPCWDPSSNQWSSTSMSLYFDQVTPSQSS